MSKYKVVIIDDEAPARDVIKHFLKDQPDFVVAGEGTNGFEGVKLIQELTPDLVFLDIQMPKLTGFEMLELIEEPPTIIFSTAYDEYAFKAFEFHAADYLLKPFNRTRFEEGLQQALAKIGKASSPSKNAEMLEQYHAEPAHQVVVKDGTKIDIIPVEEIRWLLAQDDYVEIYSKKEKFLKKQTLTHFEKILDPQNFVRVHRSSIINLAELKKIEKFGKETYKAHLNNGEEVTVSLSGYQKLKQILGW